MQNIKNRESKAFGQRQAEDTGVLSGEFKLAFALRQTTPRVYKDIFISLIHYKCTGKWRFLKKIEMLEKKDSNIK